MNFTKNTKNRKRYERFKNFFSLLVNFAFFSSFSCFLSVPFCELFRVFSGKTGTQPDGPKKFALDESSQIQYTMPSGNVCFEDGLSDP